MRNLKTKIGDIQLFCRQKFHLYTFSKNVNSDWIKNKCRFPLKRKCRLVFSLDESMLMFVYITRFVRAVIVLIRVLRQGRILPSRQV